MTNETSFFVRNFTTHTFLRTENLELTMGKLQETILISSNKNHNSFKLLRHEKTKELVILMILTVILMILIELSFWKIVVLSR